MNVTEEDVRQSLREFADTAVLADPRPAALARARRMRVRRTAGAVVAGTAMTALAVVLLTAVRPTAMAPPVTPTETVFRPTLPTVDRRVDLVDGWYFAAGPTAQGARVWNAATGVYDLYPDLSAWPAPEGDAVALAGEYGVSVYSPTRPELTVARGNAVVRSAQWNAAGDQLLVGIDLQDGAGSVRYTLADLTRRAVTLLPPMECGQSCVLVWLPGFDRVGDINADDTMTVYDIHSGRPVSVLPYSARSASAWSDDGTEVVTQSALVDAETGRHLCALSFGNTTVVHWLDAHTFIVVNETVHVVGDDCREREHRWLPANWLVTEPSQYSLGHS